MRMRLFNTEKTLEQLKEKLTNQLTDRTTENGTLRENVQQLNQKKADLNEQLKNGEKELEKQKMLELNLNSMINDQKESEKELKKLITNQKESEKELNNRINDQKESAQPLVDEINKIYTAVTDSADFLSSHFKIQMKGDAKKPEHVVKFIKQFKELWEQQYASFNLDTKTKHELLNRGRHISSTVSTPVRKTSQSVQAASRVKEIQEQLKALQTQQGKSKSGIKVLLNNLNRQAGKTLTWEQHRKRLQQELGALNQQ